MKLLTFDLEEYFHLLDYTPPSDVELIHSSLPLVSEKILKLLREIIMLGQYFFAWAIRLLKIGI